jgi:hypothetical protein
LSQKPKPPCNEEGYADRGTVTWNVEVPVAMYTSKTSFKTTVEWNTIPWQKLERKVFKLQKRIYKASQRGDVKAVRKLQKTLLHSWSAKCLAVRRVTQDNRGKKTAGVDGRDVKVVRRRSSAFDRGANSSWGSFPSVPM